MYRADKFYGPDRQVLANISLSFFPARRSACSGRTAPASRRCCGSWPAARRPRAARRRARARRDRRAARAGARARPGQGRARQRRGRRPRAARPARPLQRDLAPPSPSPTPTTTRCSPSRRRCRTRSTGATPGSSTRRSTARWTRCACRTATATSTTLSGGERRRVALCRLLLLGARPAAARRADQPPRRRVGALARALPRATTRAPSIAVTHDRYFLDNVAGWILELDRGRGIPFQGNYSSWLEQKQARLARRGEAGVGAPAHARARARVGAR